MKKTIKKYFIPHKENDHKPHAVRGRMMLYALMVVLLVEAVFLFQNFVVAPRTNFLAAILPDVLVDLTNEERQVGGLAQLAPNPLLEEAAAGKAKDMAEKGYFAHVSPDNQSPWYWLQEAGYDFSYAGENLAVNFVDSKDVTSAWMNSPTHRANILKKEYTDIGIAAARGTYRGRETIFIVQLFGRPSSGQDATGQEKTEMPSEEEESGAQIAFQPPEAVETQNSIVQGAEVSEAEGAGVLPQAVKVPASSSAVESLVSSPKTFVGYVYGVLGVLILLVLVLTIFIEIRIQHPRLIASAILLLVFIGFVSLFNQEITVLAAEIF